MEKRNSSIEMIRIIAMFMIIMSHLVVHGVLNISSAGSFDIWRGAGLNKVFSILMIPGGRVGVALFFMISGYFQISRFTISIKKVVTETFFYSVIINMVAIVLRVSSLSNLVRSIIPLSTSSWWYVSSYVVIMLCTPAINEYFIKLEKKKR